MRWADFIARTAVRRVVWIVVGLAVSVVLSFFSQAFAQTQPKSCSTSNSGCTREEAYSAAQWTRSNRYPNVPGVEIWMPSPPTEGGNRGMYCLRTGSNNCGLTYHYWNVGCPVGSFWDDALKRCFDPSECDARNAMDGFKNVGQVVKPFREKCIDGCMYKSADAQCSTVAGSLFSQCTGTYEWGGVCSASPPAPGEPVVLDLEELAASNQKAEECTPAAGGQSFCVRRDGRECYKVQRTGGEYCWRPGETGEKAGGDNLQKRDAGTQPIPPTSLTLPTGDTLQKDGGEKTVTTEKRNPNGSTTTVTTTTQNYKTEQGTDAKPGAPDGREGGKPGSGSGGDQKGDQNSATGGGDCDSPPIVKGDAILGMIADQAWHTRCAVEAGNAAKVTGDVADCKSNFTVEGSNANAVKLRAMRKQICGDEEAREKEGEANQGVADAAGRDLAGYEQQLAEAEERGIFGDGPPGGGEGTGINQNWLSFGGGACPNLSFEIRGVGTWTAPPAFCTAIAAIAALFQLAAALWALRIISE